VGKAHVGIPIIAPKANAFTETWIEGCKRECLNNFICFGLDQLDYIKTTWVRYYNTERPHRGIGMNNEVLDETFAPQSEGAVRCKQELGGVIKSYYREAA
jgi:putative transposase